MLVHMPHRTVTLCYLSSEKGPDLSPVVFVEGLTGNQYIERKADLARYREAVEHLRDSFSQPARFTPTRGRDTEDTKSPSE